MLTEENLRYVFKYIDHGLKDETIAFFYDILPESVKDLRDANQSPQGPNESI